MMSSHPTMEGAVVRSRPFLRPSQSATGPPSRAPAKEPSVTRDATHDQSSAFSVSRSASAAAAATSPAVSCGSTADDQPSARPKLNGPRHAALPANR